MIRKNKERTYRIKEIAAKMPGQPCPRTVLNWCTTVTKRRQVLLESIPMPQGRVTSLEACERFLDALQGVSNGTS